MDLLQALCFLACGAYNLAGRPIRPEDAYPELHELRPSPQWLRSTLDTLSEERGNVRSGTGTALLSALAPQLPAGELVDDKYDDLLAYLTPVDAVATVMSRMSQERRDALAVRILSRDLGKPFHSRPHQLKALVDLPDDLVSQAAVGQLALDLADSLIAHAGSTGNDPEQLQALRERVVARYGPAPAP